MQYRIDPAHRLATVEMPERVRGRDIAETMAAIYRDSAWVAGYRILWGGGIITELLFEKDDLPSFDQLLTQHAAVAPSTEVIVVRRHLDYGMAMTYAGLARSRHPVHVCRSMTEAKSILRD